MLGDLILFEKSSLVQSRHSPLDNVSNSSQNCSVFSFPPVCFSRSWTISFRCSRLASSRAKTAARRRSCMAKTNQNVRKRAYVLSTLTSVSMCFRLNAKSFICVPFQHPCSLLLGARDYVGFTKHIQQIRQVLVYSL